MYIPVWWNKWARSCEICINVLSQNEHECGLSAVCVLI